MRPPASHNDALDAAAAYPAWFPGPMIDIELFLMGALAALRILVITKSRSAIGNPCAYDLIDRMMQGLCFLK